jgi:GLPGLI family protein
MKILFLSSFVLLSAALVAQPKLVNQAIITTSTNIIAPEEEDVSQIQPQGEGRGGGFNFRTMLDGEIKSTTYIKNDLVKTSFKSETAKGTIYRDNAAKVTTTITEMMGNINGVRSTDDDQVEMKKRMDSMIAERMKTDTNMRRRPTARNVDFESTVAYTEETKKIAGYNCKKAYIITDKLLRKDSLAVWFTPELKFPNVSSTGGTSSLGMMGRFFGNAVSFDKVNGFVMMYETKMQRGRVMEVKVTKIELDKEIAAKEFEIPKDVEIKNMKDIQGQGNVRMIMGGR